MYYTDDNSLYIYRHFFIQLKIKQQKIVYIINDQSVSGRRVETVTVRRARPQKHSRIINIQSGWYVIDYLLT